MTFAYWNPSILEQDRLLNVQNGEYVDVDFSADGVETLRLGGAAVAADRYTLSADGISIRLWYDRADRTWLRLESDTEQGYTLRYELDGAPPRPPSSAPGDAGA